MLERARDTFEAACGPDFDRNVTFVQCAAQDIWSNPTAREAMSLPPLASESTTGSDANNPDEGVDLILFHAVVEWMADPRAALQVLGRLLRPCGYFSVLFYNRNSLVWRHLMSGNFDRASNPIGFGLAPTLFSAPAALTAPAPVGAAALSEEVAPGERGKLPTMNARQRRNMTKHRPHLTPHNPQDGPTVASWIENDLGLAIQAWSGIRMLHDHMENDKKISAPYNDLFAAERLWGRLEPYRSLARYIHILGKKT